MVSEKAHESLEFLKSKLLDLSLRNKLLNYRPGRSAAVPVASEVPRVVVSGLIDDESGFRFLPKAEGEKTAEFNVEFRPMADEELADHQRDRDLQTTLGPKALERTLYNLYLKSRMSFEEQGVVTLFLAVGMLRWFEDSTDTDGHLAPVLLVPVALHREGVGRPYVLKAADEEPAVNPSLLRKLDVDFGVTPDLPTMDEAVDPDVVLSAIAEAVPDGWKVLSDMHLGLFSFMKYVMYRDIEDQEQVLMTSPVVRRVLGDAVEGEEVVAPPDPAKLDGLRHPRDVHQILDADSSQQAAIEAVRNGASLVLEGPPGTGKSQTIANLIAESLADGKSVLFVSEKMAALSVVKRRLDGAGLGDYVLELHSRHTNKRRVVTELKRCLERDRVTNGPASDDLDRLVRAREGIARYVEALHEPFGGGGVTPWEAHGALARLAGTRDVLCPVDRPEEITEDERRRRRTALGDLARARAAVQPLDAHPFRVARRTSIARVVELEIRKRLEEIESHASALRECLASAAADLGLDAPADLAAADRLVEVFRHLARSPRPEPEWVTDPEWPGAGTEGRALAAKGAKLRDGSTALAKAWTDSIFTLAIEDLVARRKGHGGVLRFVKPSFWRDRKVLKSVLKPGAHRTGIEIGEDLELAIRVRDLGTEIDAADRRIGEAFGRIWAGRDTDWDALHAMCDWVVGLNRLLRPTVPSEALAKAARQPTGRGSKAKEIEARIAPVRTGLGALGEQLSARENPTEEIEGLIAWAREALARLEEIHEWATWRRALDSAREIGLGSFLEVAEAEGVVAEEFADAWEKAFFTAWLDKAHGIRPVLRDFDPAKHTAAIARFGELDESQLALAAGRIRAGLDPELPSGHSFSPESDVGLLLREAAKKRRHLPIRRLLARAGTAIRRMKPCFMMSPLSVAQFLPPDSRPFDLIVFDEASQICPEDAVGAIARARQVVVVGDSRQLPPTSFFAYDPDVEEEEVEDPPPDLESILDLCAAQGFLRLRLRWHYRSRDESLIAFSNHHFYDGSLTTFPNPQDDEDLGITLVHVPDGVYDRGKTRTNRVEARQVAEGIAATARAHPDLTVGAVTFSEAQRRAVLEELETLQRDDRELEALFLSHEDEPLFVKNLENVQGDERDVMFFSVGYGPDTEGKVMMNFGPLNGDGGHRRLNVAVTRARRAVKVYSALRPEDIDLDRARSQGAKLLRSYLDYAARGVAAIESEEAEDADVGGPVSVFTEALAESLRGAGLAVEPRVGTSDYRLDLAVRGEAGFILGVETDGPIYRRASTARDRDRLRRQVLERLGWRLERVWSTEYVRSPHRVVERLVEIAQSEAPDDGPPPPPAEEQIAPEMEIESPDDDPPPGVAAWVPVANSRLRIRKEFAEAERELPRVVTAVVEHEGPIHEEALLRRVVDAYDTRLVSKARTTIGTALEAAIQEGDVERRGDFLWRPGETVAPPRGPAEDGEVRPIEQVPEEEIAGAVGLVLETDLRLPEEALVKAVARVLGHRRMSDSIAARIGAVLADGIAAGTWEEDEGYVRAAAAT